MIRTAGTVKQLQGCLGRGFCLPVVRASFVWCCSTSEAMAGDLCRRPSCVAGGWTRCGCPLRGRLSGHCYIGRFDQHLEDWHVATGRLGRAAFCCEEGAAATGSIPDLVSATPIPTTKETVILVFIALRSPSAQERFSFGDLGRRTKFSLPLPFSASNVESQFFKKESRARIFSSVSTGLCGTVVVCVQEKTPGRCDNGWRPPIGRRGHERKVCLRCGES